MASKASTRLNSIQTGLVAMTSDRVLSEVVTPLGQVGAPAVQVRDVSKTFFTSNQTIVALEDIDLTVEQGEFVCLIGPSGCGKSTLLKIIGGLLAPTGGEVLLSGKRVKDPPQEAAMMFQKPVLLEWRTILDNVILPLEVRFGRKTAKKAADRAAGLLSMVGLDGFESRYPNELSGGMQQRAAICRMLIGEPSVLLLDEPFAALDELTRERLNLELADIVSDAEKATVLVTHNIGEGVFLSDRVVVLSPRPGRVAGIVKIPFERPRKIDLMPTPDFQALAAEIRRLLKIGQDTGDTTDAMPGGNQ